MQGGRTRANNRFALWYHSSLYVILEGVFFDEYGLTDAVDMQTLTLIEETTGMNNYEVKHK